MFLLDTKSSRGPQDPKVLVDTDDTLTKVDEIQIVKRQWNCYQIYHFRLYLIVFQEKIVLPFPLISLVKS